MRTLTTIIVMTALILGMSACKSETVEKPASDSTEPAQEKMIQFRGKVVYLKLEGGFYGIVTADGRRYRPLNLPESYRSDGLIVQVTGVPDNSVVSYQMWGTALRITRIRRAD